ncbi:peptidase s41 family protein [Diplodia corticola]|uniref:Peptidase s41 family protein n=1 Tax=Diplodia corticola TaxID=236234 RepID=A0A1J9QSJ9_9PEZI|nr:peptidase s41 family protein [Diplodia corticola]OJD31424.1 peptidase s41 family protein [Diplodia corticola]
MVHAAAISAAMLSAASLAPRAFNTTTTTSGDACAQLSQLLDQHPGAKLVRASEGYSCLKAVPVDVKGDAQLVSEIYNILTWHSPLAYLKDPPEGYPNPPVDLLAGLEDIQRKIVDNEYESEYDVQNDITVLLSKGYDGHLAWIPDISSVISFNRLNAQADLVSLSLDGKSLPKVYLKRDIDAVYHGANFTPSALHTIDNQTAYDYLVSFAEDDFSCHDPDARYQDLFYNPAGVSQTGSSSSFFTGANKYVGDKTILGHENGTKTAINNYAFVPQNLSGITSGSDLFEAFLTGPSPTPTSTATDTDTSTSSTSATPIPTAYNYPYPVNKASDNTVSGYFLNGTAHRDVAVLSSPSFEASNLTEFQTTVRHFLAAATAANKTRLIIDLRHNGGGLVNLGYDLFKQLFPQQDPFGATRVRAVPAIDAMGLVTSAWADAHAANESAVESALLDLDSTTIDEFWYRKRLDAAGRDFASWPALFGPDATLAQTDNFTHLLRKNWSDVEWTGAIAGYGALAAPVTPPQPFAESDVVLLQDGYCASTCAVFSELVRAQAPRVRSVVLGGRPRTGPAVAVGGTKGAETLNFGQVVEKAEQVVALAAEVGDGKEEERRQMLEEAGVVALTETDVLFKRVQRDSETGAAKAQINYRDNYRWGSGEGTGLPLQFVADYADCRLWYTPRMLYDVVAVWETVGKAVWGGGDDLCVEGSTGYGTASR